MKRYDSTQKTANPIAVFLILVLSAAALVFSDTAPALAQAFQPADKLGTSIMKWIIGAKWLWVLAFIIALLAAWSPRVPFNYGGVIVVIIIIGLVAASEQFVGDVQTMATK